MTDDFFDIVGSEHNPTRICSRFNNGASCTVVISSDPELQLPQQCNACKQHYVVCDCGEGISVKYNAGPRLCYDNGRHVCPRIRQD